MVQRILAAGLPALRVVCPHPRVPGGPAAVAVVRADMSVLTVWEPMMRRNPCAWTRCVNQQTQEIGDH